MSSKREKRKRERARRRPVEARQTTPSQQWSERKLLEQSCEDACAVALDFVGRSNLAENVDKLADRTRDLALTVINRSPLHGQHACKEGCAFCCHTVVTASVPELVGVVKYLREHYSESELQQVRRRIDENAALARTLPRNEYIARNVPCAMLTDDGRCRVHPVRPFCCAGYLSTSREKCEAEFHRLAGRDDVPTDRYAMLAGLGVSYGLKQACSENNLDGTFYELHSALQRALDDHEVPGKWAKGERPLDGCLE